MFGNGASSLADARHEAIADDEPTPTGFRVYREMSQAFQFK